LRGSPCLRHRSAEQRGNGPMMWHVVFAESGGLPRSRAARSRDSAIQTACELLDQSFDVRRVIEPSGAFIERPEFEAHYDKGRFPGLNKPGAIQASFLSQPRRECPPKLSAPRGRLGSAFATAAVFSSSSTGARSMSIWEFHRPMKLELPRHRRAQGWQRAAR